MELQLLHPHPVSLPSSASTSSSVTPLIPSPTSLIRKHAVQNLFPGRRCANLRPSRPVVRCSASNNSSSNSQEPQKRSRSSPSGPWDEEDTDYVEAHVMNAVSLLPSQGHLFVNLADGGRMEIQPPKGFLFGSRNPAIVLKIVSESELLLPILVGNMAIDMLMSGLHGEENVVRPNQYHIMKELVGTLDLEVRMVRVTERILDTYHARIYVGKPGEKEMQSVDARPSDAVNLAVRCKAPIYVHKDIVLTDAVTPIHTGYPRYTVDHDVITSNLDRPLNGRDHISEELGLVKNMLLAAAEERYNDAARLRDELNTLRRKRWRIRQR